MLKSKHKCLSEKFQNLTFQFDMYKFRKELLFVMNKKNYNKSISQSVNPVRYGILEVKFRVSSTFKKIWWCDWNSSNSAQNCASKHNSIATHLFQISSIIEYFRFRLIYPIAKKARNDLHHAITLHLYFPWWVVILDYEVSIVILKRQRFAEGWVLDS